MATISASDLARLGQIRPELWNLFVALHQAAADQLGFTVTVPADGGTRTASRQAALYADSLAQGHGTLAYPVAPPGKSRHNYGAAFDLNIVRGGSGDGGRGTDDDYRQLADAARALGLTAGYYFSNSDPYHFQLNETLEESQARWAPSSNSWLTALFGALAVALLVSAAGGRQ